MGLEDNDTELGRTFVIGKASYELLDACETAKQAQKLTLNLIKSGADPKDLLAANNAFLKSWERPLEKRVYAHGQGYDLV